LFRPLVIGAMLGCVALSLVELIRLFAPAWNGTYLVVGCVLAALEATYSYRLVRARWVWDAAYVLRFRAIELAMFFILLKIGGYIGDPWAAVLADIRTWPHDPPAVIDPETVVAFVLAVLSWEASTQTVRDLERLYEPPERSLLYVPPTESLTRRFFWGGAVLLIATGITRIGIAALLNLSRPPVPGLVLNVLVYFLLGLVMLGQVHFTWLRKQWQAQEIKVTDELASRWVRYSLAFTGLAALLAFLLPTGYTVGLLDAVSTILQILAYGVTLLFTFLLYPFGWLAWLMARLFGGEQPPPQAEILPLQLPQREPPAPGGAAPDWLEILRSVLFWAATLGMLFYVVRSYLRDRPELLQVLFSQRSIRALRDFLITLWRRLLGLAEAAGERIPRRLSLPWARPRLSRQPFRLFRLGALSPRERILYYYLSIVERARRQGYPRRSSETPYEYDATLGPKLPEARQELTSLTQAFIEARYSRQTFDREQDRQVRSIWKRVRAALQALKRK
jgi:predicted small integral membrane protein